jgi:UDP-N-acetylmuramate dehydrogenase
MKITELLTQHQIPFKANESLAPYTYIKIGGPAQYLVVASDIPTLKTSLKLAHQTNTPYTVLGSASNVLIADEGLAGLTIINRAQEISLDPQNPHRVITASGTLITQLIHFCQQHQLSGLEDFLGLPGTVGGAVYNNSHHLDHLIGEYVDSVTVITPQGQEKSLKPKTYICLRLFPSSKNRRHGYRSIIFTQAIQRCQSQLRTS